MSNLTGISVSVDLVDLHLGQHGPVDQLLVAADLQADFLADVVGRALMPDLASENSTKGLRR